MTGDSHKPRPSAKPPRALPEGVRLVADLPLQQVQAIAFSPNGTLLATGNAVFGAGPSLELLQFWDASTGQLVRTLSAAWRWFRAHRDAITALAFSADGRFLATGDSQGGLNVWDWSTGKSKWLGCRLQGARIISLAFLPGSQWLAVGSRRRLEKPMLGWKSYVDELGLRSVRSGKLAQPVRAEYASALAAPPAGDCFATSGDGLIRLWKGESAAPWSQLKGHAAPVNALAYSADGRWLASGSEDRSTIVWSAASGETVATLRFSDGVKALAFSPQGSYLASLAHRLVLWDTATREAKLSISGVSDYQTLAYSANGKTLAAAGENGVRLWELSGLKA